MRSVIFNLPTKPISLHACFKNVSKHGRAKTPAYKAWLTENAQHVRDKHPDVLGRKGYPRCMGWVAVSIIIQKPDERKSDLDNKCKAILDLLTSLGVIEDDSKIAELNVRWSFFKDVPPVTISVREICL